MRDDEPVTRSYLLPDHPESAGLARTHVRALLRAYDRTELADDATLLVSELVTNALRHAAGKPELRLDLATKRLRIEVVDAGCGVPSPATDPHPDRTSGRGLWLVERVASRWGFVRTPDTKSVWCELPVTRG